MKFIILNQLFRSQWLVSYWYKCGHTDLEIAYNPRQQQLEEGFGLDIITKQGTHFGSHFHSSWNWCMNWIKVCYQVKMTEPQSVGKVQAGPSPVVWHHDVTQWSWAETRHSDWMYGRLSSSAAACLERLCHLSPWRFSRPN